MANTFKNYTVTGTTAGATAYTVPADTTAIFLGMNLSNISTSSVTVSVQLGTTYIIKDAPLPVGSALSILDGKMVGEAAEAITVTTSADSAVDVILSVMEQA